MDSDPRESNATGATPQRDAAVESMPLPADVSDAMGYEAADPVLQALWADAADTGPMPRSLR
jgi:hypothetical protein